MNPGAVGVTYPFVPASFVRIDALYAAELEVTGCRGAGDCGRTRDQLMTGLGRAVGATAAHELGH